MALRLTQPLTEMSTRNISGGGKGGRCIRLTTLPPLCAHCLEIWEPQPPGTLWDLSRTVMGELYLCPLKEIAFVGQSKQKVIMLPSVDDM
jgi:hypothetical protein